MVMCNCDKVGENVTKSETYCQGMSDVVREATASSGKWRRCQGSGDVVRGLGITERQWEGLGYLSESQQHCQGISNVLIEATTSSGKRRRRQGSGEVVMVMRRRRNDYETVWRKLRDTGRVQGNCRNVGKSVGRSASMC